MIGATSMNHRVTIYDVANKTGYSIATVNRALSNKARISETTKKYIVETAHAMGYEPSQAAAGISRAQIRIGVVIHRPIHAFIDEIQAGIESGFQQIAYFNVAGDVYISESADTRDMLDKIREMVDSGVSGMLIMPPAKDDGFAEVIAEIRQKGVITATVVSDLPGSVFSVRNNGIVAGNMAAEMLHMLAPGRKVATVTANRQKTVHRDTITGFYQFADAAGMDVVGVYEHHDNPQTAYRLVDRILEAHPDIGGVYLGSANSITFCRRLVELDVTDRIKIVASDVFAELTQYLKQDVVQAIIFQHPFNQGRLAIRYLYEYLVQGRRFEQNVLLMPQLVVKSNIDYISN